MEFCKQYYRSGIFIYTLKQTNLFGVKMCFLQQTREKKKSQVLDNSVSGNEKTGFNLHK